MSKAEQFIKDYTSNCSNYTGVINKKTYERYYIPWLTPDQARKAVEIAREEMIEKVCSFIAGNIGEYIELKNAIPTTFFEIDGDRLTND